MSVLFTWLFFAAAAFDKWILTLKKVVLLNPVLFELAPFTFLNGIGSYRKHSIPDFVRFNNLPIKNTSEIIQAGKRSSRKFETGTRTTVYDLYH